MAKVRCTCASEFQDELYGIGIRIATEGKKDFGCTVCGKRHTQVVGGNVDVDKKEDGGKGKKEKHK